ncbi:glycosyltransferase [Streptomyces polyrhachis]|uniref:Glycosyltransferase n=1 Tax=Streptomyces polyrhachis TaxID=1282885 RepID=A0ABW2GE30_9ACTN
MKKIVIINSYVRENGGDAALTSVCLRQIREAYPGAEVVIAGMEDAAARPDFEGAPNLGSIRRYVATSDIPFLRRQSRRVLIGLLCAAALAAPRPLGRLLLRLLPAEPRREAEALASADLVVSTGGAYVLARKGLDGYQNVYFVLLPALLAQRAGVPVVFAPQSFGPFPARVQRLLVRRVLGRAAAVLAREDVSVAQLRGCGLPAERIQRAVDSGFAFEPPVTSDWRARLGLAADVPLVGVTARRWLAPAAQERYERAVAATIDDLQARGARVVLIPQVSTDYMDDDDRIVERRIADHCASGPLRLDERVDYRDLKGLYHQCRMLIGTRFHSVIFALTSGVPCVAIEYEHKTRGIMADLGLGEWVIPIEDVTHGRLRALAERLYEDPSGYRATMAERLPAYTADAERFPALLRAAVPPVRPRTVAIVSAYYPPKVGGVENYAAHLARAVAAAPDLRPVVITTRPGVRTRVSTEDGVRVVRLGAWTRLSNTPLSPLWPFQLRHWLRRTGAEVVNAHAPVPGLADLAAALPGRGRPSVLTYHAGSMHKGVAGSGLADRLIGFYERRVLPRVFARSTALVAVCEGSMAARVPGSVEITPGVDLARFTPGAPPSTRPRTLVYAGRMDTTSPWKGVDRLIRAFAQLDDVPGMRLKLVGGGDDLSRLLALAAESGVRGRVDAVGELHGTEMTEALRTAAVLALPSLTDSECFGTILAEAMACGTPVIASTVGGLSQTTGRGEAGLLVPPDDPSALAAAVRELLADPELADRLGAAGRARAEAHYDWQTITGRYVELFRSL